MRKFALLLACLVSCFITVFAQGEGGGSPVGPIPLFKIQGVEMDQPRPYVVGETTSQYASLVGYNTVTGEPVKIPGFVGFTPKPSDPNAVRFNFTNPSTGEINFTVLQPEISAAYFVSDRADSRGKLLGRYLGALITGIQPEEQARFARSEVIVHPDEHFVRAGKSTALNVHYYGNWQARPVHVRLRFIDPNGQPGDNIYTLMNPTLSPGKKSLGFAAISAPIGRPAGRYYYTAVVVDNSGLILGINRFEIVFGEYDLPGRFGGSLLNYAYVGTDCRNQPIQLQLSGIFPDRFSERDVRVLLNGELVSEAGVRSFVNNYSVFSVSVNVEGIPFPAAEYDVTAFFLSTGLVIHKKAAFSVDTDFRYLMDDNCGYYGGGPAAVPTFCCSSRTLVKCSSKAGPFRFKWTRRIRRLGRRSTTAEVSALKLRGSSGNFFVIARQDGGGSPPVLLFLKKPVQTSGKLKAQPPPRRGLPVLKKRGRWF